MHEFVILKAIFVLIHAYNAPLIKEVIWNPLVVPWIKCNTDDTSKGCTGPAAWGGIFRDNHADVVGCFTQNLNISA
ncbi:putative ribonuclease H protein, partial [Trifolium medium]|nr:putative ribonuclease H protein [Trifolium medium]